MKELISVKPIKIDNLKRISFENLNFGKNISDHMFSIDYKNNEWLNAQIGPFTSINLSPATLALHYGQTVFEGMKAFKMIDGNISIFRIDRHYQRFCKSLDRMCMPKPSYYYFEEGLKMLVNADKGWVPDFDNASLYLRPFMFASEEKVGVSISEEYKFIIFAAPVHNYYPKPLKIKIEDQYIRAAKGGTGYAKCGGNYGGALYPTQIAKSQGFDQLLWTDCSKDLYIEESGTMNIIFVIDGKIITPKISDTILDGITRDCVITFARDWGYEVDERKVSAMDLIKSFNNHTVQEAFGCGTAAVTSAIELINIFNCDYRLPDPESFKFMKRVKTTLTKIRTGEIEDKYHWNTVVN